jgi:hypothetical protein
VSVPGRRCPEANSRAMEFKEEWNAFLGDNVA